MKLRKNIFKRIIFTFPFWGILLYLIFGFEIPKPYRYIPLESIDKSFADSLIVPDYSFLKSVRGAVIDSMNLNPFYNYSVQRSRFFSDYPIYDIEKTNDKRFETIKGCAILPDSCIKYTMHTCSGQLKFFFSVLTSQVDKLKTTKIQINNRQVTPEFVYEINNFKEYKIPFKNLDNIETIIEISNNSNNTLFIAKPSLTQKVNRAPRHLLWIVIDAMRQDVFNGNFDILIPTLGKFRDENYFYKNAVTPAASTRSSMVSYFTGMNVTEVSQTYMTSKTSIGITPDRYEFYRKNIKTTAPILLSEAGFETVAFVNNALMTYRSVSYDYGFSQKIGVRDDAEDKYELTYDLLKYIKYHPNHDLFIYFNPNTCHSRYRTDAISYLKSLYCLPLAIPSSRDLYFGTIGVADRMMNYVFNGLKKLNIYDDAKIIFHSDHGQFLIGDTYFHKDNEKSRFERHGNFMTPEAFHVPLILKGFDVYEKTDTRVSLVDILPTISDQLNKQDPGFSGKSLLKIVEDRTNYISGDTQFGIVKQDKYYEALGDRVMKFSDNNFCPIDITFQEKEFLNFGRTEFIKRSMFMNKVLFIDRNVSVHFISAADSVGTIIKNDMEYNTYSVKEFPVRFKIDKDYLFSQKYFMKIPPAKFLNFTLQDFIDFKQEQDLGLNKDYSFYSFIDLTFNYEGQTTVKLSKELENQLRDWGYIK